MPYCYDYPRPAVSSDCVVFGFDGKQLNVLLIERKNDPFKGYWSFPGGFLEMNETSEQCAMRELEEETGLHGLHLEQIYTFSGLNRDPRGRVISVAYLALVRQSEISIAAGDDASQARWFPAKNLPPLAFDHDLIYQAAIKRLKVRFCLQPVGYELLEEKFTLPEVLTLYELVTGIYPDRRNFFKRYCEPACYYRSKKRKAGCLTEEPGFSGLTPATMRRWNWQTIALKSQIIKNGITNYENASFAKHTNKSMQVPSGLSQSICWDKIIPSC